jgi:hypothetical protein
MPRRSLGHVTMRNSSALPMTKLVARNVCAFAGATIFWAILAGAQRDSARADRPVRIALASPSILGGARAQIILRGGPNQVATVLLDESAAGIMDLVGALARVQSLYTRNIAPGLIIRTDLSRPTGMRELSTVGTRRLERVFDRMRRKTPARVPGYGMLRWVTVRSSRADFEP